MSDGTPIIIKKVKGHGGHAHHGGSWKVAYADFVTAMMAFFMVMWIMGLSDETRAQVAGYFNDPLGFKAHERSKSVVAPKAVPGSISRKRKGDTPNMGPPKPTAKDAHQLQQIQHQIEQAIQHDKQLRSLAGHVEMVLTQEGLRIELVESKDAAFFQTGSAVLSETAVRFIHAVLAPILVKQDRYFIVEGHTDSRPYGGTDYTNWDLSCDRARSLWHELWRSGMSEHRLTAVRGLADTQLKDPKDPFADKNRRVTVLLPFKVDRPGAAKMPKDALPEGPLSALPDVDLNPRVGPN